MDRPRYGDSVVTTFDWTGTTAPSTALITAMAEVNDVEPLALEPLFHAVDPDALDSLFAPTGKVYDRLTGTVEFDYAGHRIVITASGRGYIYDGTAASVSAHTPTSS